MQIQLRPAYIPWLFDSREAWENAVRDSRFRYEMAFDAFMGIYNEYRHGSPSSEASIYTPQVNIEVKSAAPSNQEPREQAKLLSQSEIDELISSMPH